MLPPGRSCFIKPGGVWLLPVAIERAVSLAGRHQAPVEREAERPKHRRGGEGCKRPDVWPRHSQEEQRRPWGRAHT